MLTESDLRYLRQASLDAHSQWKREILMSDEIAGGRWEIMWPDHEVESSDPLVENIYGQALEDKTITAGSIPFQVHTQPTRGTRKDEGEKNAQKRKRVFLSYHERSNLRKMRQRLFRDWYHTGVMAGNPWATGFVNGRVDFQAPAGRFAYFQTVNPRHLYPLGWDNRGRLTAGLVIRRRTLSSLKGDWGETHPALLAAELRHKNSSHRPMIWLEEIWFFDQTQWALALGDSSIEQAYQGHVFGPVDAQGNMVIDWLVPPAAHRLNGCPLKAVARTTYNDSPRGALVDIIPGLRVAQNFMARLLDDLNMSMYAPVVLDNIENPDEYGLGAVLIGTGQGNANIIRDRPPVNFEAQQTVQLILDQTRRQAFEPAQRSGDPQSSISSGKAVNALMGTFNAELAAAQQDAEVVVADLTSATAAMDEQWCFGEKQINVADHTGEMRDESYDPAALFKSDYRVVVSYGDRTGLDTQQHLTQLALVRNLGGMSLRTFMAKSGMVDDALAEETEMAIESMVSQFTSGFLPQQVATGNLEPMLRFIELIDTDKKTAREAMFEVVRSRPQANPADGQPDPGSPQARADIIRMVRSLGQGGIPGNAEGQPPSQLPGPVRRQLAETAPGSSGP